MKLPEIMLALVSYISSRLACNVRANPQTWIFSPANNSLINKRMIFFTDPWQLCSSAFVQ